MTDFRPRPGDTAQNNGRRFEKVFAKIFGVLPVRGSGSVWHSKLDVSTGSFLFSLKHTDNASFRLSNDLMVEAERAVNGPGGVGGTTIPAIATSIQGDVFVTLRVEDFLTIIDGEKQKHSPQEHRPSTKADAKRSRAKVPGIFREEN